MFSLDFLHFGLIFDALFWKQNVTIALSVYKETPSEKRDRYFQSTIEQYRHLNPCKSFHGLRVILGLLFSLLFHLLPQFSESGSAGCKALFQPISIGTRNVNGKNRYMRIQITARKNPNSNASPAGWNSQWTFRWQYCVSISNCWELSLLKQEHNQ